MRVVFVFSRAYGKAAGLNTCFIEIIMTALIYLGNGFTIEDESVGSRTIEQFPAAFIFLSKLSVKRDTI